MKKLSEISEQELMNIINCNTEMDIEISEEVTNFKKSISTVNFSTPREVRPTPIILTEEGIAQVLFYSGNNLSGKYVKLVVFVYALGGKILYSNLSQGNYKAEIKWS